MTRPPRGRPTEDQLARRYTTPCFLRRFSTRPCAGPPQLVHLIPKQRMRQNGVPEEAIWDPRVLITGCELHHHALDHGFLEVPRDEIPFDAEQFAAEVDLAWSLDRDFPSPTPEESNDSND